MLKECVIEEFTDAFFVFDFIPDKYKTQEMCEEAVGDSWAALKLIPDWSVTSKMI